MVRRASTAGYNRPGYIVVADRLAVTWDVALKSMLLLRALEHELVRTRFDPVLKDFGQQPEHATGEFLRGLVALWF